MTREPTKDQLTRAGELVDEAGGFKEAERWMRLARPGRDRDGGRPRGLKYRDPDARILWVVSAIRHSHLVGPWGRFPSQHRVIKTIVGLCFDDPASDFARVITGGEPLGASRRAVIERLMDRNPLGLGNPYDDVDPLKYPRLYRLLKGLYPNPPDDVRTRARLYRLLLRVRRKRPDDAATAYSRLYGLLLALHRKRPDLQLLPPSGPPKYHPD